jgi:hypothetical protein
MKQQRFKSDGSRVYLELPEIPFVPVLFPRTASYALTLPVAPGDFVLLVFCTNYTPTGTGDGAALKAVLSTFLATTPSMSFVKTKAL